MDLRDFVSFEDGCMITLPVPVIREALMIHNTYEFMSTRLNQLMQSCFSLDDLHDASNPYRVFINLEQCRGYLIFYFNEPTSHDEFSFSQYMISSLAGMIYIAETPYPKAGIEHYFKVYNVCVDPEARGRKIMTKMMDGVIQSIRYLQMPFYLDVYIYNSHALHVLNVYMRYRFNFSAIDSATSSIEFVYQGDFAGYTLFQLLEHLYGAYEKPEDNERIRLLATRQLELDSQQQVPWRCRCGMMTLRPQCLICQQFRGTRKSVKQKRRKSKRNT